MRPKVINVICEGSSEVLYLRRLNAFIGQNDKIWFVDKPKGGIGGGSSYMRFNNAYKNFGKSCVWAWADADLYVRNEDGWKGFVQPSKFKFKFSIYNFEDFLALHFDDDLFHKWIGIMSSSGHFDNPLTDSEYSERFRQILPDYRKGSLPEEFIQIKHLMNMRKHICDLSEYVHADPPIQSTFADSVIDELLKAGII